MGSRPAPTGVCIIRVRADGDGLRFAVMTTPDVLRRREHTTYPHGIDDVLEAVTTFLDEFARRHASPP